MTPPLGVQEQTFGLSNVDKVWVEIRLSPSRCLVWLVAVMDALPFRIWTSLQRKSLYDFSSPARIAAFGIYVSLLVFFIAHVLVLNDHTYVNTMAHDVFLFIDGTYRVSQGSVPHIDFVTSLGALNFYGPYWLERSNLMLALPRFVGGLSILLMLWAGYIGVTRLNLWLAYLLVAFVTILAAAPSNIGDPSVDISFAMFYNRLGYAFLVNLVLLMVPPVSAGRGRIWLEGALIGLALAALLHLKVTFFAAALGIVGLSLFAAPSMRKPVAFGLLLLLAGMGWIHWHLPHFYPAYVNDLFGASASRVSDGAELSKTAWERFTGNLLELTLVMPAIALVWMNRERIPNALAICLLYVALALGAFPLLLLNCQQAFLVLPAAVAVHAAVMVFRCWEQQASARVFTHFAVLIAISFYLMVPFIDQKASALDRYRRYSHSVEHQMAVPAALRSFVIDEVSKQPSLLAYFEKNHIEISIDKVKELSRLVGAKQEIIQTDYLYTILDGAAELHSLMKSNGVGPVVTFDFSNPFPALLNLPVCSQDYLWIHPYVNISEEHHLPASEVLHAAQYVAIPKYPVYEASAKLTKELYLGYVRKNFRMAASTPLWQFWVRDVSQASTARNVPPVNAGT